MQSLPNRASRFGSACCSSLVSCKHDFMTFNYGMTLWTNKIRFRCMIQSPFRAQYTFMDVTKWRNWQSLAKQWVGEEVDIIPYSTRFPFSSASSARAVQQRVCVCVCFQICITELVIVTYCGYLQSLRAMLCPWWQCVCVCQMEGCSCQLSASVVMKRDWKSSSLSLLSLSAHYVQLQMTF